jgi:hypothetical protein
VGPPYSLQITRVRRYSGFRQAISQFRLLGFHHLRPGFPARSTIAPCTFAPVQTPHVLLHAVWPLSLSLATTHEISVDFSSSGYLDVSVPRVPRARLCVHLTLRDSSSRGFPHSDIHGSQLACSSPWLFAACHVLLRLLMPRHPPYALYSLNMSFLRLYRFERKDLPLLNSTYIATVAALCPSSLSVRLRLFLPSRINSYSVVNEHLLQPSPSCGLRADISKEALYLALAVWWAQVDSNYRPRAYQARALTT